MKILVNSADCLKCGDIIYSRYRSDYVTCSCGNISVDGGMDYLKHSYGDVEQYKDTSITIPEDLFNECMTQLEWCDRGFRSNSDRLCVIFRAIRDNKDV